MSAILERLHGVRRAGSDRWTARCPAHPDRQPSLSIRWSEDRWLLHCHAGCDVNSILTAVGLEPRDLFDDNQCSSPAQRQSAGWCRPSYYAPPRPVPLPPDPDDEERTARARSLWLQTRPAIGSVVERYLQSRAITCSLPPAVRFLPRAKTNRGWTPAMAVGMQCPSGEFCALQLTYLLPDGSGKADVEPQKQTFGPMRDAVVRLGPPAETVILCEGTETGLAVVTAGVEFPVWVVLGGKRMKNVVFPDIVRTVVIAADRDDTGIASARLAAESFGWRGLAARIVLPPAGDADFNDTLRNGVSSL